MISREHWSIGRGEYKDHTPDPKFCSISSLFSSIITGPYDQDVSLLMVGKKGKGKSSAALSMGYHTALKLAEILGGKWNDYFGLDHVAIVDPDAANKLLSSTTQYGVYLYDDIGVGWNARNYASDENKDKNDIFQINRVDSTFQIMTVPNQFLLDKVPRSLVSHYAEMDKAFFHRGFTTIKLFEPETLFRAGKIVQPYLVIDRSKFISYQIEAPPHDLWMAYKKERKRITDIIKKNRGERMSAETKSSGGSKREVYWNELKEKYKDKVTAMVGSGKSHYKVAIELGLSPSAVGKILSMG